MVVGGIKRVVGGSNGWLVVQNGWLVVENGWWWSLGIKTCENRWPKTAASSYAVGNTHTYLVIS